MSGHFELLQIARLVGLAADTVAAYNQVLANGQIARIMEVALRIKAAADELEEISRAMKGNIPEGDG